MDRETLLVEQAMTRMDTRHNANGVFRACNSTWANDHNHFEKHHVWIKKKKLKYKAHYTDSDHVCVKENGNILTLSLIK